MIDFVSIWNQIYLVAQVCMLKVFVLLMINYQVYVRAKQVHDLTATLF